MHGVQKHDTDTSCYRASPMTAPVAPGFYSSRCMPHAKSGVAGFRAAGAARERGAGGGPTLPLSVKQHFIGSRIDGSGIKIILDDPHVRLPASRTRAKLSISGEAGCGPRDSRRRKRQGAGGATALRSSCSLAPTRRGRRTQTRESPAISLSPVRKIHHPPTGHPRRSGQ